MTSPTQRKICLITGACSGLGKAAALRIAERDSILILACRDERKGMEALKNIRKKSRNQDVELMVFDLASFGSIRKFAQHFKEKFDRLDILINNAATYLSELRYTPDNIEMQFATNYLGPFLLTNLLWESLKKSESARIINVTSDFHFYCRLHFDDLFFANRYSGIKAYNQSKLALIFFTYELSRRLESSSITANCVHPGGVKTDIGSKNASGLFKWGWTLIRPFLASPEKRAKNLVHLACSQDVEAISGQYFEMLKPKRSSKLSYDKAQAARLWDISEKMTGLSLSSEVK